MQTFHLLTWRLWKAKCEEGKGVYVCLFIPLNKRILENALMTNNHLALSCETHPCRRLSIAMYILHPLLLRCQKKILQEYWSRSSTIFCAKSSTTNTSSLGRTSVTVGMELVR